MTNIETKLIEAVARLEEQGSNTKESIDKLSDIVYRKIDDLYNKFLEYRQEVASQQQLQAEINSIQSGIKENEKETDDRLKSLEKVKLTTKEYKTIIAMLFVSPLLAIIVPIIIERYGK